MNNLFYDLPEDLQDSIMRMNPHPLHTIFHDALNAPLTIDLRNENKIKTNITNAWSKMIRYSDPIIGYNYYTRDYVEHVIEMRYGSDDSDDESYDEQYGDPYESVDD